MDQAKVNALAERLTHELNGAFNLTTIYLGYHLGLFTTLAEGGPATPTGGNWNDADGGHDATLCT